MKISIKRLAPLLALAAAVSLASPLAALALPSAATAQKPEAFQADGAGSGHYEPRNGFVNKWGPPIIGTGATVSWSLMDWLFSPGDDGGFYYPLSSFMPTGFKREIKRAFDSWSAVADITFVEVQDPGGSLNSEQALGSDIRIGGHRFTGDEENHLAHAYYPPPHNLSSPGDIHFNIDYTWVIGPEGDGYDIYSVAAHEIGHAIGIAHSDEMGSLMHPYYSPSWANGPLELDIRAAQYLYGARERLPAQAVPDGGTSLLLMASALIALFGARSFRR